ncbi:MAG: hypothetical protein HY335_06565 [Deinococcus sp.]|nr:hypothetical protein [Deinococcus sp.]
MRRLSLLLVLSTLALAQGLPLLLLDQPVQGAWEPGDQLALDGSYLDSYVFQGTSSQQLSLELRATVPGLLLVTDLEHKELGRDGDGLETISQVILTLLTDGLYLVTVNAFSPGQGGSYTLTLTTPPPLSSPGP